MYGHDEEHILTLRILHPRNCRCGYTNELIIGSIYNLDEVNKKRVQNIEDEFLQLHLKMKSLISLVAETKMGVYEYYRQVFQISSDRYSTRLPASQCNSVTEKDYCLLRCDVM
jgi:hypothetical protein